MTINADFVWFLAIPLIAALLALITYLAANGLVRLLAGAISGDVD